MIQTFGFTTPRSHTCAFFWLFGSAPLPTVVLVGWFRFHAVAPLHYHCAAFTALPLPDLDAVSSTVGLGSLIGIPLHIHGSFGLPLCRFQPDSAGLFVGRWRHLLRSVGFVVTLRVNFTPPLHTTAAIYVHGYVTTYVATRSTAPYRYGQLDLLPVRRTLRFLRCFPHRSTAPYPAVTL